jgi:hypothetical protein
MKNLASGKLARFALLLAVSPLAIATAFAQRGGNDPDHQQMLDQLGITGPLRPGPRGSDTSAPDYANYDESKATAKSPVPPLLAMADGRKITTPAMWEERRKELFEIFDREFYGRLPEAAKTIKVTWEITGTTQGMSGKIPTITRRFVGHVDNSSYPAISVDIGASVTTPANAAGKVPVIFTWGGGGGGFGGGAPRGGAATGARGRGAAAGPGLPVAPVLAGQALPTLQQLQDALSLSESQVAAIRPILEANLKAQQELTNLQNAASRPALREKLDTILADESQRAQLAGLFLAPRENNPPFPNGTATWQEAAVSLGWGYGSLDPASIQADTGGAALRQGIIGLINQGHPRKPDDWGALRAWAWGATKLIDFLETDTLVDAKQVAFEGHSRFGKATLAALVYEPRVFTGFVSSSGEGGAKLWRHLVGEQVESLASWNTPSSEYHWMAGNFLKYAGPLTVDDLPADAHQFVALIAPRPVFISGGEYHEGNGKPGTNSTYSGESWQDTPGTFMGTAGASPVWKLLGKKGLSNDKLNLHFDNVPDPMAVRAQMPPMLTPLIDGDIAFRQHGGGHEDGPNWSTFIEFARRHFKSPGFKN